MPEEAPQAQGVRTQRRFLTHRAKDRWVLALLAAAILITLAPVFTVPYGFLDDYAMLVMSLEHPGQTWETLQFFTRDGRSLNGFLILRPFRLAGCVEALAAVRFFGALGVAALAGFVFTFLRSLRWRRAAAALLAVGLASLPTLLLFSSWTQQWPLPWAALLAGLASVRLWRYVSDCEYARRMPLFLPFLWMSIGFQIHQAVMSFFWFFFAIVWLSSASSEAKKFRFLRLSFMVFAGAAAVSFLSVHVPAALGLTTLNSRAALTPDPLGKLVWFLNNPVMDAASLWWIVPVRAISWGVLLACVGGLALMIWRKRTLASGLRAVGMGGVLLATYFANLVVAESWSSYRTQGALAATILLMAACACRQVAARLPVNPAHLRRAAGYAALALCPALLIFARRNLNEYVVIPQNREFVAVSSAVKQRYTPQLRALKIIQPDWTDSLAPAQRYDEFGMPSLFAQWVPVPFTKLALHDLGVAFEQVPPVTFALRPKEMPKETPTEAVINAAAIFQAERRLAPPAAPAASAVASKPPAPTGLGPELLQRLRKIEAAYAKLKSDTGRDTNQIADLVVDYSGLPHWKGPYLTGERSDDSTRTNLVDKDFSLLSLQVLQRAEGGYSSTECGGDVWKKAPIARLRADRCAVYIAVAPVPPGDMLFLNSQIDGVSAPAGVDDPKGRLRIFLAGGAILYQLP